MKLNLACGNDYREGYLNVDNRSMNPDARVDMVGDVFSLGMIGSKFDEILLSHFAMYIDTLEMPVLLKKWHSWLNDGGELIIETGDIKKIAKTILSTDEEYIINGTNGVMQLFGWANTKGHKWAWCADTLIPFLKEAGFISFEVFDGGLHNRPERDVTIIAKK